MQYESDDDNLFYLFELNLCQYLGPVRTIKALIHVYLYLTTPVPIPHLLFISQFYLSSDDSILIKTH